MERRKGERHVVPEIYRKYITSKSEKVQVSLYLWNSLILVPRVSG